MVTASTNSSLESGMNCSYSRSYGSCGLSVQPSQQYVTPYPQCSSLITHHLPHTHQSIWPNLPSLCPQFEACRVLAAMVAFAWLGWIVVFALMVTTLMYATANSSWSEPAHGHWVREDPNRASVAGNYFVRERA